MTDKKEPTKAGATELTEEEVGKAQGGWKIEEGVKFKKNADKVQPETSGFSHEVISPRKS